MTTPHAPRRDLYAEITAKLVAAIEANPGEPQMPWRRSHAPLSRPTNAHSGKPYRGINIVLLWVAAEEHNFSSNLWATYKQYGELGAQVRKGEKSSLIVKYGEYTVEPDTENEDDDGRRLYLKSFHVFNAGQVDGYVLPEPPPSLGPVERIEKAEAFIAATGARIVYGGDRAFYRPSTDTIHMPNDALFTGTATMNRAESHAAVKAHELLHWSGAKHRVNRDMGKRYGDAASAGEELVAEIGSALICAILGITQDVRPDHAQYLALWLALLKDDPKAIFTAAARAAEAVDYLESLQPKAPEPTEQDETPGASKSALAPFTA